MIDRMFSQVETKGRALPSAGNGRLVLAARGISDCRFQNWEICDLEFEICNPGKACPLSRTRPLVSSIQPMNFLVTL